MEKLRQALEATGSLDEAVEILLQIQMSYEIGAGAPPPEPPPLTQPPPPLTQTQPHVAQVQVPLLDDPMAMDLDEDHARTFAGLEIQDVEPLGGRSRATGSEHFPRRVYGVSEEAEP